MRVKFSQAFDYTPSAAPQVQLVYSPKGGAGRDGEYTVRRECGEAAVAAGKAVEIEPPGSDDGEA